MKLIFEADTPKEFLDELTKVLERMDFTHRASIALGTGKRAQRDREERSAGRREMIDVLKQAVIVRKTSPGKEPSVTMILGDSDSRSKTSTT